MKHVGMSQVPRLPRETRLLRPKPPRVTTFAELAIGTAIGPSRERLRTVAGGFANGCIRLRNVERTHPQPPDPQSETGTLARHSGKHPGADYFLLLGGDTLKWDLPF